jgi:hypothetical protein
MKSTMLGTTDLTFTIRNAKALQTSVAGGGFVLRLNGLIVLATQKFMQYGLKIGSVQTLKIGISLKIALMLLHTRLDIC